MVKTESTMQEEFDKRNVDKKKAVPILTMEQKLVLMRTLFGSDVKVYLEVTAKGVMLQAVERKREEQGAECGEGCEECGSLPGGPTGKAGTDGKDAMKEAAPDFRPAYFG